MQIAMQRHEPVLIHLFINYFRIFKATMSLTALAGGFNWSVQRLHHQAHPHAQP